MLSFFIQTKMFQDFQCDVTGHIGIAVPDVNAACKLFEEQGVTFVKKPDDGKIMNRNLTDEYQNQSKLLDKPTDSQLLLKCTFLTVIELLFSYWLCEHIATPNCFGNRSLVP